MPHIIRSENIKPIVLIGLLIASILLVTFLPIELTRTPLIDEIHYLTK